MIQELREYSNNLFFKLLMGVIAVTFVFSFGVGGFFGDQKEVVAKVNDREILLKEYREAYQNRLRILEQQFGENAEQFAEQLNLRQQVFNQLIDRYLLLTDADEFNLVATDLELQDFIKKQPFFHQNGQFDYETYEMVLKQNRIVRYEYENSLREDILLSKKERLLSSGLVINDNEIDQAFRREYEKIEVEYIYFDPQSFTKKINIEETELRKYHQDHPQEFQTLNQFQIEYFIISGEDFQGNINIREREIRRYYKKYAEKYITPPEVKARHILLKLSPEASETEQQEKRNYLEKVLSEINSGNSFEELAREHSEDATSSEGGDLGWFKPGEMVPEFESAAFNLNIGEVSKIVRSPFGLHIIKIEERKDEIKKSLDDVRDEITITLREIRSQKKLKEELDRLAGLAANEFLEEAKRFKSKVLNSEWFDRTAVIAGLGSVSDLVPELIRGKTGEIGIWKRNPVLGHVIYRLNEKKLPEEQKFSDAKDDVFITLRLKKAKELAIERAKTALSQINSGTGLNEIAKKYELKIENLGFTANTRFLPKVGENNEFRKVGLQLNKKSRFGLSLDGNRADLILFKKRSFSENKAIEQKEKVKEQLLQNMRQALMIKELKRLRDSATIEVINPVFSKPDSS